MTSYIFECINVSQSFFLNRLKFEIEKKWWRSCRKTWCMYLYFYICTEFGCSSLKFNDGAKWSFSGYYSIDTVLKPSCFTVGHRGSLIHVFANSSPLHTGKYFFVSAACRRALQLIARSWPNKILNAAFGVVYLVDLQAVWFSTPNPAWALTGNENYKISFIILSLLTLWAKMTVMQSLFLHSLQQRYYGT